MSISIWSFWSTSSVICLTRIYSCISSKCIFSICTISSINNCFPFIIWYFSTIYFYTWNCFITSYRNWCRWNIIAKFLWFWCFINSIMLFIWWRYSTSINKMKYFTIRISYCIITNIDNISKTNCSSSLTSYLYSWY